MLLDALASKADAFVLMADRPPPTPPLAPPKPAELPASNVVRLHRQGTL